MTRTYTNLLTHLIFSTKEREPLIRSDMKAELHAYLGGLTKELKGKAYGINGIDDHVHMLVNLPPHVSVSDAMRFIKSNSSAWVHERWSRLFNWQPGYGAFRVSKSNVPQVLNYIANQESHHRKVVFRQEFIDLLSKHDIPYDERYLWV
jgi:REP element-mobilizing transposase RayT